MEPEPDPHPFPPQKKRVHTPTIIQIEAVECGAVCLAIILRFFGKSIPIEEARMACDISRSGSNAKNLLAAARQFGLEAQGWRQNPDDLPSLPLPMVLFWKMSHFVVFEGSCKKWFYLNDPATGPRKVGREEFDRCFSGIALTFRPGPDFQPSSDTPNLFQSLAKRLPSRSWPAFAFLLTCGICLAWVGLITPAFQHVFVDEYLVEGLDSWVKPLLWIMLATTALSCILDWMQHFVLTRLSTRLSLIAEGRFLWHLLHLPSVFFSHRFAGELTQRTTINDKVATLLTGRMTHSTISLLTILPYAFLLFSYDWKMAAVGLLIACLNLAAMQVIARVRTDSNSKLLQDQGTLMATAVAGWQNIESIKATASEDALFSRLAGSQAKVVSGQQKLGAWSLVLNQGPSFLNQINTAAMLGIGGLAIIDGHLTIGYLLAFQSLMGSFTAPFSDLASLGGKLQEAKGEIARLDDVLASPSDSLAATALPSSSFSFPERLEGKIELRNVVFGYSKTAPPLLENFNLTILPGQRIALVGASGCGKTTVVSLIAGLLQPWSGDILFDGKPRSFWPRPLLAKSLGHVGQTFSFFEGNIAENISLFDPSIPMEKIIAAAKDACVHDVISARPGGYFSPVGENGRNFSGGQSQRMEIARALAHSPTMILLDEATSALDPVTEKNVDDNLRHRRLSTLISAHRLSTIRDAEEILVLEHGKVLERGTHEELLQKNGLYRALLHP